MKPSSNSLLEGFCLAFFLLRTCPPSSFSHVKNAIVYFDLFLKTYYYFSITKEEIGLELVYLSGLFWSFSCCFLAKKNNRIKQLFSKITIAFLFIYLVWRLFFTIPIDSSASLVFGIILYIAEVIGLFVYGFCLPFSNKLSKEYRYEGMKQKNSCQVSPLLFVLTMKTSSW